MAIESGSVTFSGSTPSGDYSAADMFVVVGGGDTCALSAPSLTVDSAGSNAYAVAAIDGYGGTSAAGTASSAAAVSWSLVSGAVGYAVYEDGSLVAVLGTLDDAYPPPDADAPDRSESTNRTETLPAAPPMTATRQLWRYDPGSPSAPPAGDGSYTAWRDDRGAILAGGDLSFGATYRVWVLPDDSPLDITNVSRWNRSTLKVAFTSVYTYADILNPPVPQLVALAPGSSQRITDLDRIEVEWWGCFWTIDSSFTAGYYVTSYLFDVGSCDGFTLRDLTIDGVLGIGSMTAAEDSTSGYHDRPTRMLWENVQVRNYGGVFHVVCLFAHGQSKFVNCLFRTTRRLAAHGIYIQQSDWGNSIEGCTFDGIPRYAIHLYGTDSASQQSGRADLIARGNHFRNCKWPLLVQTSSGVVFSGNTVRDCVSPATFLESQSLVISGNMIEASQTGFELQACKGGVIQGNVLSNIAKPGDANTQGVYLTSRSGVGCSGIVVANNVVTWTSGSDWDAWNSTAHVNAVGINVNAAEDVLVVSNVAQDYSGNHPIKLTNCTRVSVDGNRLKTTANNNQGFYMYACDDCRFVGNAETNGGTNLYAANLAGTNLTIGANTLKGVVHDSGLSGTVEVGQTSVEFNSKVDDVFLVCRGDGHDSDLLVTFADLYQALQTLKG